MEGRSAEIAEMPVAVGFISSDTANRPNAAVEVLSTLLPEDATIEICLTLEGIEVSDEAYVFEEAIASFDRPPPHQRARGDELRVTYWNQQNRPVDAGSSFCVLTMHSCGRGLCRGSPRTTSPETTSACYRCR